MFNRYRSVHPSSRGIYPLFGAQITVYGQGASIKDRLGQHVTAVTQLIKDNLVKWQCPVSICNFNQHDFFELIKALHSSLKFNQSNPGIEPRLDSPRLVYGIAHILFNLESLILIKYVVVVVCVLRVCTCESKTSALLHMRKRRCPPEYA